MLLQVGSQSKNIFDIISLECAGNVLELYYVFCKSSPTDYCLRINPINSWREWGLVLVRLNDSSVVALTNQMPGNCNRSTPLQEKSDIKI